jgi:hypothetical protein
MRCRLDEVYCKCAHELLQCPAMIGAGLFMFNLLATTLASGEVEVSNGRALEQAVRAAPAGATIALAPGTYSGVRIENVHGSVKLTSADPARQAVFTDLNINGSSGITIEGVTFSTASTAPGPNGAEATIPFQIGTSSGIVLEHLVVHGSPGGNLATDVSGMLIRSSDHITVADSDFAYLHNALEHLDDSYLTVTRNHFHHLRDDGLRGGGSSNVLITENRCDSNHPDGVQDPDHPDCIQFWTTNTHSPAHDITIARNIYERGDGTPTQGIFLGNELKIPYQKVVITGNTITGALWHGITAADVANLTVENNVVCPYADQMSWIMVRDVSHAVVIGNSAGRYMDANNTDVREERNRVVADCHR